MASSHGLNVFVFVFVFVTNLYEEVRNIILEEFIQVKVGSNASYYNNLGYKAKHGDVLFVKNEDAPRAMRGKEERICDLCGKRAKR